MSTGTLSKMAGAERITQRKWQQAVRGKLQIHAPAWHWRQVLTIGVHDS